MKTRPRRPPLLRRAIEGGYQAARALVDSPTFYGPKFGNTAHMPVTRLNTLDSRKVRDGNRVGMLGIPPARNLTSPQEGAVVATASGEASDPLELARRSPRRPPPTGHLIALAMHRTGMLIPHSKVPDLTQIGGRCCLTVGIVPQQDTRPLDERPQRCKPPDSKKTILLSPPGTGGEAPQHTISPDCLSAQL